jgi:hypothetical protein
MTRSPGFSACSSYFCSAFTSTFGIATANRELKGGQMDWSKVDQPAAIYFAAGMMHGQLRVLREKLYRAQNAADLVQELRAEVDRCLEAIEKIVLPCRSEAVEPADRSEWTRRNSANVDAVIEKHGIKVGYPEQE